MLRSLYGKLAIILAALLAVIVLVQMLVTMRATQMYLAEANQRLYRDLAENILAEEVAREAGMTRLPVLPEVFATLMALNPALEFYLLDPGGRILAHGAPEGRLRSDRVPVAPIRRFLAGDESFPIEGADPREPGADKVFSAAALEEGGEVRGYLYVILGGEQYRSILRFLQGSEIARLSLMIILGAALFGLLAGLLLFRSVTRRLTTLSRSMEAFQGGDPGLAAGLAAGTAPAGAAGDEIDRLEATYAALSRRVRDHVEMLEEVDALRRELVASVSHDLRTPLATLQAYLETLIETDEGLGRHERRRYLEGAVRHAQRLSRLVDDLLDLAKLDAGEVKPEVETFNLAELAQDVTQKFELEASRRGISLKVKRAATLPPARADIGLAERVLENLFDNALRYTPPGGEITLDIDTRDGDLAIEVRDTGPGIPPEEIKLVFDRFYRGSGTAQTGGEGMGLGLAIVKRIVELHGGTITVESRPGEGTGFRFTLPAEHAGDRRPRARSRE